MEWHSRFCFRPWAPGFQPWFHDFEHHSFRPRVLDFQKAHIYIQVVLPMKRLCIQTHGQSRASVDMLFMENTICSLRYFVQNHSKKGQVPWLDNLRAFTYS